jgi:ABC-type uncharacterized transport system permease subunit
MTTLAAGMAVAPLTTNCLLGCAGLFLAATVLDAYAAKDGSGKLKAVGLWMLRGGLVMLTAMLAYQGLHAHTLPIGSTPELLLALGWGLTALTVFLDLTFEHRLPTWAIALTTTGCLVAAAVLGLPATTPDTTAKPMIVLHVATAVLAYCVLGAQALNSLAYLLQHRALARRRFGGIYAFLPALVPLERVGAQLLGAAVWMLGLSLVIGAVDWSANLSLVTLPKLGAASAAWLGALFVAVQRRRERLLGPTFARASLWLLLPALLALWLSLPAPRA